MDPCPKRTAPGAGTPLPIREMLPKVSSVDMVGDEARTVAVGLVGCGCHDLSSNKKRLPLSSVEIENKQARFQIVHAFGVVDRTAIPGVTNTRMTTRESRQRHSRDTKRTRVRRIGAGGASDSGEGRGLEEARSVFQITKTLFDEGF